MEITAELDNPLLVATFLNTMSFTDILSEAIERSKTSGDLKFITLLKNLFTIINSAEKAFIFVFDCKFAFDNKGTLKHTNMFKECVGRALPFFSKTIEEIILFTRILNPVSICNGENEVEDMGGMEDARVSNENLNKAIIDVISTFSIIFAECIGYIERIERNEHIECIECPSYSSEHEGIDKVRNEKHKFFQKVMNAFFSIITFINAINKVFPEFQIFMGEIEKELANKAYAKADADEE